MGLEIPDEIKWLSWIIGADWPEGDEAAMRRGAQAWYDSSTDLQELIGDLQTAASQVLAAVEGQAAEQFEQYWNPFTTADPQYLVKLQAACANLGKAMDNGALEI